MRWSTTSAITAIGAPMKKHHRQPSHGRGGLRERKKVATRQAFHQAAVRLTFVAALRVALHIWLDAPADTPLDELVDRALAEAGRGFG